eukprot:CAMPEP_0115859742 /NCGR_PEP_ID=MMETSP0287-20121206/16773_1 /TAXON_ID=412157 /ORGANISM="Chrysochromulina rotalis, Strain UIO044" /LENGTH=271 /DNA_ID=CAMNT_0003314053 /DNA_START=15 /DNA_END=831 /DNA_ORIENTATION=+
MSAPIDSTCNEASGTMVRTLTVHATDMSAAGTLLRIAVGVEDAAGCAKFYTEGLGLTSAKSPTGGLLVGGTDGPQIELCEEAGAGYKAGGGFSGVSLRVASVASAVESATACGGTLLSEPSEIEHGPSYKPIEEPDEQENKILEAIVADPSGYPVLLHEDEGAAASTLSGVRVACHTWKETQEWYEALGWKMLRFNSNVHREPSITITVGEDGDPIGPRGRPRGGVVQLTYHYGCPEVEHSGGLEALVVAAGERDAEELRDPDGYIIRLEK